MYLFEQRAATILYRLAKGLPGDGMVLLPANVCPVVPLVFAKAGVKYEFVDISPLTLCMDEDSAEELLRQAPARYVALVFVRAYGHYSNVSPFFARLKVLNPELLLIDDRCLMPPDFTGTDFGGADLLLYSTGYSKIVDLRWGGFALTGDGLSYPRSDTPYNPADWQVLDQSYKRHLGARMKFLYRDSDWLDTRPPVPDFAGYRKEVLGKISAALDHRQRLNDIYTRLLPAEIQLPSSWQLWRFNVMVPDKEGLLRKIAAAGLFASSHYASLGGVFSERRMVNAERVHHKIVNLFNDFHFDESKAEKVAEIVNRHLDEWQGDMF